MTVLKTLAQTNNLYWVNFSAKAFPQMLKEAFNKIKTWLIKQVSYSK